jgi:2-oxoglutarate dehydrogenase E2 component (dihydrolipoamide succinyltransferase)
VNIEVKVPQLPESVTDATLVAWHRKVGEAVRRDENLVDLETDKVVLEVPAPTDGVVVELKVADGATVTSGQVLAVLQPGAVSDEPATGSAEEAPQSSAGAGPAGASSAQGGVAAAGAAAQAAPATAESAREESQASGGDGGQRMGPAVRNLIEEHDLDPADILGSGREGRITKTDVLEYLARARDTNVSVEVEESVGRDGGGGTSARSEQRVPMTRLRARIAERLVEAQQTAAMLTTFNEADMSAVMALRSRYQERFQKRYDVKLGYMSFFVRAVIESLRQYPLLNASIDGKEIVHHEYFDIGVAVSTERGLVVPVLRDAQLMGFADIEKAILDYGTRARQGDLGMEELTGGTFTITNGGIFGSLMSTPIINPPQSGILGMHTIQERPVAVDGKVEIRPMMYLALTYDHRIVDGREAVQFLVRLKEQLEDPARLILQI